MALKHSVRYPGQTNAPSASYPHGSAKNINVPGDGTGYPLEKDWVNDLLGFQAALLAAASIDPNELPDTALVSQYFQALEQRITSRTDALIQKTIGIFSPLTYDADGDGTEDDTEEVQDCMDAAYAAAIAGGGNTTVDLGGLTYRVTATLSVYPHVNVINGKLLIDHATLGLIDLAEAATLGTFANWENVELDCAQAYSGNFVTVSNPAKVKMTGCRFNESGDGTGALFISSDSSECILEDCTGNAGEDISAIISTVSVDGTLLVRGGKFSAPAAFEDSIVLASGGRRVQCEGVVFDLSAVTTGLAACVQFSSASVEVIATGCEFVDGSPGNVAFRSTGLDPNEGRLTERDNKFTGSLPGMTPFDLSGHLLLGSSVEGLPHVNASTGDENIDVPAHARTYSLRSARADTTPANITFADPIFAGQVLHLQVANDHTVAWSGFITLANVIHQPAESALENLAANSGERLFLTLVAHRYEGTLDWYLEHIKKYTLP